MKKTFASFGNCQADAIKIVLDGHEPFTDRFDIKVIPPVHTLMAADRERVRQGMPEIDLFLAQDVSEVYAPASTAPMIQAMRPGSDSFVFPVCWMDAYFPDMIYAKDEKGATVRNAPCDYHSEVVLRAFAEEATQAEAVQRLVEPWAIDAKKRLAQNLVALRKREADMPIKIADFVEERFSQRLMFHTFNHPTADILYHIIDTMLGFIGVPPLGEDLKARNQFLLGNIDWRINRGLADALDLKFTLPETYEINGVSMTPEDYVMRYYSFYQRQPAAVETFRKKQASVPTSSQPLPKTAA